MGDCSFGLATVAGRRCRVLSIEALDLLALYPICVVPTRVLPQKLGLCSWHCWRKCNYSAQGIAQELAREWRAHNWALTLGARGMHISSRTTLYGGAEV